MTRTRTRPHARWYGISPEMRRELRAEQSREAARQHQAQIRRADRTDKTTPAGDGGDGETP